jgi:peptidoglycan/LPS O-acetylase OafA/YrhL
VERRAGFRPDIEGLRGVAVLLVVLGHLAGWPRGGFVGVDVFFVISGFLITGLLVREREATGRVSLTRFYLRRARRLLPAGVLVLVVTDVAAGLVLLPSRAHATVIDSLWSLGLLANVRFAQLGTDYFSLTRAPSAVQHYWSLSVEEQFYLVWPLLVLAAFAVAGRRAVVAVVSIAAALSLSWSVLSTAHSPASAYFSSSARAWELGAGALLVLAARRLPGWVAWVGAGGLAASVVVITPTTPVPGYALLLPVLATVAVLGAGGDRLGLSSRPVRYVGKISYSLYLWHWPVVVLGSTLVGGTTVAAKVAMLIVSGALAVTSYHLVEQPFRHPRPSRSSRLPAALAPVYALCLVTGLVAAWVLTEPVAGRPVAVVAAEPEGPRVSTIAAEIQAGLHLAAWPPHLDAELVDPAAPEWVHDRCLDVSPVNADRCTYGSLRARRSIGLLGDSVAVSWLPALRPAAEGRDARIHVLTRRQCPNLLGFVSKSCAQHHDWALSEIRRLRPELVIMSARYEGKPTPEQWREGTRRMVAAVAPYTRRIVVLAPPPETANLQSCHTRSSTPADCIEPVSTRRLHYAAAERQGATPAAEFVDSEAWFCAAGRCPAVVADVPVMFDGRHLTAEYAERLTSRLTTLIR